MPTNFKRTFGNATSPLALSYLDDNFSQLEAAGTSTVTLSGAQLIGFMQSGSGAVARTVESKDQDLISVLDFMTAAQKADVLSGTTPTVDTSAAILAAVTAGPAFIPGKANCLMTTIARFPTGAQLYGPGKITFTAVGSTVCIASGNPSATDNTDKDDIVVEGVHFYSTADVPFLTFISLANNGGDLTNVRIRKNFFEYDPATFTGGDRWAVNFGGEFGDERNRLKVSDNLVMGPMQLTSGGQNANYTDVVIQDNVVVGGRNACIAMTRLDTGSNENTYKRITIKGNHLYTDRTLGIFLGADSETASTAPHTWEDIVVEDNVINIEHAVGVSPVGILFRAPEGAGSSVDRFSIRKNRIRVSTQGVMSLTLSNVSSATPPATFNVYVTDNEMFGGELLINAGNVRLRGNKLTDEGLRVDGSGAVVDMSDNDFRYVRNNSAGGGTIYSYRNRIVGTTNGEHLFNIGGTASVTYTVTSIEDYFDYRGSSGNAATGFRLAGASSTIVARLINPQEAYRGWSTGFLSLNNSQLLTEYRRGNEVYTDMTAVGNAAGGEDTLITYDLPAGSLSVAGRGVHITAFGHTANNSNPKTVKLYFGTVAIISTALTISQAGYWRIESDVVSTGTDAQDETTQLVQGGTTTIVDVESGNISQNDGAAITIKCTGTVTDGGGGINNNDIQQEGLIVRFLN